MMAIFLRSVLLIILSFAVFETLDAKRRLVDWGSSGTLYLLLKSWV